MEEFVNRRNKLAAQMQNNSIAILPGGKLQFITNDTEYPFRQNSDFYYLTGYIEPDAVMALSKDAKGGIKFILFNISKSPEEEFWTGKCIGQDNACAIYKADEAYDVVNIDDVLPKLFADKQIIYYPLLANRDFDLQVLNWLSIAKQLMFRKYSTIRGISFLPDRLFDLLPMIHELRLLKSELEISYMRKAAEISAQAHIKLMQIRAPGQMEYQLEAKFMEYCLSAGCGDMAYKSIIAAGNNGSTLHYVANQDTLRDGELVLVDAGGAYKYYCADITRTYPIGKKFSVEQRQIYEIVLEAQLAGIEKVKPGNRFDSVQEAILPIIVDGLLKLGLLTGNRNQIIKEHGYNKFYMHSSGHWLGLDTHDVGKIRVNDEWRKFEPGMVVTVEPGIYISKYLKDVDPKWHGIVVRVEDDVLVTKHGYDVLSKDVPKTIDEMERAAL